MFLRGWERPGRRTVMPVRVGDCGGGVLETRERTGFPPMSGDVSSVGLGHGALG